MVCAKGPLQCQMFVQEPGAFLLRVLRPLLPGEAPTSRQRWGSTGPCSLCAPVPHQARSANDLEPHPSWAASAGRATPRTLFLADLWTTSCLPVVGDTVVNQSPQPHGAYVPERQTLNKRIYNLIPCAAYMASQSAWAAVTKGHRLSGL